jgi:hypothetical protein
VILAMFAAFIYCVHSLSPTCITQGSPQKREKVAFLAFFSGTGKCNVVSNLNSRELEM